MRTRHLPLLCLWFLVFVASAAADEGKTIVRDRIAGGYGFQARLSPGRSVARCGFSSHRGVREQND